MGNSLQATSKITHTQDQGLAQQQQIEFTCEICIEPASMTRKFHNKNLCSHPFCVDCIAKYVEVKILDNSGQIACPGLNCQHNLDAVSTMSWMAKPLFSKWCDLLCEDSVLGLDRSYCPNRECMALVVNECGDGNVKKTKCPNCKELFCFNCKKEWHAGFTCEESEVTMRDMNDVLFGMLVEKKNWQRCPACGHCVQLREGCSIVKCRCKTKFCYRCGKKTTTPNHNCPETRRPPDRRWELIFIEIRNGILLKMLLETGNWQRCPFLFVVAIVFNFEKAEAQSVFCCWSCADNPRANIRSTGVFIFPHIQPAGEPFF
ncbi:hypothetical protein ACFE04_006795 [Oxalis oulophora]